MLLFDVSKSQANTYLKSELSLQYLRIQRASDSVPTSHKLFVNYALSHSDLVLLLTRVMHTSPENEYTLSYKIVGSMAHYCCYCLVSYVNAILCKARALAHCAHFAHCCAPLRALWSATNHVAVAVKAAETQWMWRLKAQGDVWGLWRRTWPWENIECCGDGGPESAWDNRAAEAARHVECSHRSSQEVVGSIVC